MFHNTYRTPFSLSLLNFCHIYSKCRSPVSLNVTNRIGFCLYNFSDTPCISGINHHSVIDVFSIWGIVRFRCVSVLTAFSSADLSLSVHRFSLFPNNYLEIDLNTHNIAFCWVLLDFSHNECISQSFHGIFGSACVIQNFLPHSQDTWIFPALGFLYHTSDTILFPSSLCMIIFSIHFRGSQDLCALPFPPLLFNTELLIHFIQSLSGFV